MAAPSQRGAFAVAALVCAVCFAATAQADDVAQAAAAAPLADPAGNEQAPPAPDLEDSDASFDYEDAEFEGAEVYDPFEYGNRAIYRFNGHVSDWVWDPITSAYRFVVPSPARRALRRALTNLNAPIYFVNHLLQLHPLHAAETAAAFAMNTTFGVGGLFDTASGVGFDLRPTDFGQTLGLAGVGAGPYLVVPLLGPTTVRDGMGFVVDRAFHPLTYFIGIPTQLWGYGGLGFTRLEEAHDDLAALEESALDPYAVLRSAYVQSRESGIEAMRHGDDPPDPAPPAPDASALASGERTL